MGGGQFEVNILDADTVELLQMMPFPGATALGVAFVNGDC